MFDRSFIDYKFINTSKWKLFFSAFRPLNTFDSYKLIYVYLSPNNIAIEKVIAKNKKIYELMCQNSITWH